MLVDYSQAVCIFLIRRLLSMTKGMIKSGHQALKDDARLALSYIVLYIYCKYNHAAQFKPVHAIVPGVNPVRTASCLKASCLFVIMMHQCCAGDYRDENDQAKHN